MGRALCGQLERHHRPTLASGFVAARARLEEAGYDAVLVEDRLSEPAGVEFLAEVAVQQPQVIRLLMSASVEPQRLLKAINETHVFAFLQVPLHKPLLLSTLGQVAQMRAVMKERDAALEDLCRQRDELEEEVVKRTKQLADQNQHLEHLAMRDPLTSLFNRRYIEQRMDEELLRLQRYGAPLSILLFDIDNFKAVNDTEGHAVGDKVLIAVAGALADSVRQVDLVARFGGEEFLVLLPNTGQEAAELTGARLCRQIAGLPGVPGEKGGLVRVTASGGVASARADDKVWAAAVERADRALYAAKHAGKNCVRVG